MLYYSVFLTSSHSTRSLKRKLTSFNLCGLKVKIVILYVFSNCHSLCVPNTKQHLLIFVKFSCTLKTLSIVYFNALQTSIPSSSPPTRVDSPPIHTTPVSKPPSAIKASDTSPTDLIPQGPPNVTVCRDTSVISAPVPVSKSRTASSKSLETTEVAANEIVEKPEKATPSTSRGYKRSNQASPVSVAQGIVGYCCERCRHVVVKRVHFFTVR